MTSRLEKHMSVSMERETFFMYQHYHDYNGRHSRNHLS